MTTAPSSLSACDALILTALREELDAVIERGEGQTPWEAQKDSRGCLYYTRTLHNRQGQALKLAAASVSDMGKAGTAARSTQLLIELNPPCILMCGICAGNKSAGIQLGDLVVADRVYSYDSGKHAGAEGGREEIFYHDITTYNLERAWKHQVEDFLREPQGFAACKKTLDTQKPPSKEAQQRWLLHRLYEHQQMGAKEPLSIPERKTLCPDWDKILDHLEAAELIELDDALRLSPRGITQMKREKIKYPDGWPEEPGVKVHIGAMATGEAVQEDKELFAKLKPSMRKTMAVEMEAAAVGYVAEFLDRRALIVKAVADFGDADKDDRVREFACRASAVFVMAFVKHWLEPASVERETLEPMDEEDEEGEERRPELEEWEHRGRGRRYDIFGEREDPFWKAVSEVTRLRNTEAQFKEKRIGHGFAGLIEVRVREGNSWITNVVAGIDRPYSEELLQTFIERIEAPYRRHTPMMRSTLVHGGEDTPAEVQERYLKHNGILLTNLSSYQCIIDFGPYLEWQNRQLDRYTEYPSHLYIEQRADVREGFETKPHRTEDIRSTLREMLHVPDPRFVLLLGEAGRGKTFLLREITRQLAREQPGLVPVLVEMGKLEKDIGLSKLLGQHFTGPGISHINVANFLYELKQGRIALLLDGFDELTFREDYDRVMKYFGMVMEAAIGRAKVVVASRYSHFISDRETKKAMSRVTEPLPVELKKLDLARRVEPLPGLRTIVLSTFDEQRIRTFFVRYLGQESEADERLKLLRNVEDLMGLCGTPRMMGFVAALTPDELREAARGNEKVTAGSLYQKLMDDWFEQEERRTQEIGGEAVLTRKQMSEAMRRLALEMWCRREKKMPLNEMPPALRGILQGMEPQRTLDGGQAAQTLRSRSMLIRDELGQSSFLHQSVMEWWVAKVAADEMCGLGGGEVPTWERAEASDLMAGFFVDLCERPDWVRAWTKQVLQPDGDKKVSHTLKSNVLRVLKYLDKYFPEPVEEEIELIEADWVLDLSGQDLRGRDFSGSKELKGADLRGADLRGATLLGADLSGAVLSGANLSRANLEGANLSGAELDGADFSFARAMRADFTGARSLERVRWTAAKLLGAGGEIASEALRDWLQAYAAAPPTPIFAQSIADTTTYKSYFGGGPRIAYSRDGRLLAWVRGNTVRIYDGEQGQLLSILAGHAGDVTAVAFNHDGSALASASRDNTAKLWDARSGSCLLTLKGHQSAVYSVAFNHDGSALASASLDNTAKLWDARSGSCLLTLNGHQLAVSSVAFNHDGSALASASFDNTAKLWDARSGSCLLTLNGHQLAVSSVAFNHDGSALASASSDNTAKLWDARSGSCLLTLNGHQSEVSSVAFNPDGSALASASLDKTAKLWDTRSGTCLLTLNGHQKAVLSVAFNPGGSALASASYDNTAKLWDTRTGTCLLTLNGHQFAVSSVAFNPDGSALASASSDKTAKLWNTRSGSCLLTLKGHQNAVSSVAFNPDGSALASASSDKTAKLWDARSGKCLLTLVGHTHSVTSVAFNPTGTRLITSSYDGTIRFWSTRTGECLAILFPLPNGWAAYRPKDGRFRAQGDLEGRFFHTIGLCRFEPGELDPYLPTPLTLAEGEPLIPDDW